MTPEHTEFLEFINEYAAEELVKAKKLDEFQENLPARTKEPQTFFVNPYDFTGQYGLWRERRSNLTWDTLRVMAEKNPIISSIVNTRTRQVGVFSTPISEVEGTGNDQLGFKIVYKDANKKLSKSEIEYATNLERFIANCGYVEPGKIRTGRDNFDTWLKKIIRDSLSFDAGVTELVPTRKGGLHSFYAIDAATIRMAATQQDEEGIDDKRYVQVLNGQIVTEYEPDEIMYGIRNPTTNIRNNGYGVSELEQLVSVVSNIFNAMTHNSQFFQNGAAVKGLINIKTGKGQTGVMGDQLEAFKRAWRAMVTGTKNAWSTPILQTDGVEFVNMSSTNREMEFTQYLAFLVKIACAVYSIDPAEINFYMNGGSGGSAPLFESSQEAKLKMSKDKGLRPLLASISRWVNHYLVAPVTQDWKFTWVGIDSKDEKEIIETRIKEVGAYLTVDEARAEVGRDALGPEKGGDIILNSQYVQYINQKSMAASMAGGGGSDDQSDPDNRFDNADNAGSGGSSGGESANQEENSKEAAGEAEGDDAEGVEDKEDAEIKKSLEAVRRKYLTIMIGGK